MEPVFFFYKEVHVLRSVASKLKPHSSPSMAYLESEHDEEENGGIDVVKRGQWLRAAILGANDGLLSTTALMLGVGAAKESREVMVLSGVAGAVAGALSMALGEFVSVSTQRDIEKKAAALKTSSKLKSSEPQKASNMNISVIVDSPLKTTPSRNTNNPTSCRKHIAISPETTIISPGRSPTLRVIMENDKRNFSKPNQKESNNGVDDEEHVVIPNPYKAAAASASAFLCGSLVPVASAIMVAGNTMRVIAIVVASSLALVVFGGVGAYLGGSPVRVSAVRVLVGGWIAMGVTYGLLKPFDKDKDHGSVES